MIDGTLVTGCVLVTFHGTIVRFDEVRGCLRHDVIGKWDANVYATQNDGQVILSWQDGNTVRPLGHYAADLCTLVPDSDPGLLSQVDVGHNLIALCANGRYMCAEADGVVTFSRLRALEWESFLLIELGDFARLEFVLANGWFSRRTEALIEPGSIRGVGAHMIEMDHKRFRIADVVRSSRTSAAELEQPRELFLVSEGWRIEHYILFRPLAFFVAYGNEELFKCAEIAIRSLFDFGEWNGDVLLITDTGNLNFAQRLPIEIRGRIRVVDIPAADILDFTLARYKIADLEIAESYQPLLYMDTDMVCDAPISSLLLAAVVSPELQILPEFPITSSSEDFYGQLLLSEDGVDFSPDQRGFSSGMFLFRNLREQRLLFRAIVDSAYRFASFANQRDSLQFYDQPVFNYVLIKSKSGSGSLLSNVVELYHNHRPNLTVGIRKEIVHFAGGVGNSAPKLTHMMAYTEVLHREGAEKAAMIVKGLTDDVDPVSG